MTNATFEHTTEPAANEQATEHTVTEEKARRALREDSALLARSDAGLLIVTDADRADFLHRMTTNEINRLQPGESTVTVLTNATARVVHVFTVLCKADALWLLPAPGAAADLARHLQGQIFFMDKVQIQNASDAYRRLRIVGPQAEQLLESSGLPVAELAAEHWVAHDFGGDPLFLLQQQAYDLPGYELVVPTAHAEALQQTLQAAGATVVSAAAYAERRIELGRPAPGHELVDSYNPLEAGLGWACADDKGCYTGQEIIARQITYDKITKTLVGLRAEAPLTVGQELVREGRKVGTVTSAVESNALGAIALAVVKRPHNQADTELQVGEQSVRVVALPFAL